MTATVTMPRITINETEYVMQHAVIESTQLGINDHGCFSSWLHLTYRGSGQGAGGYALDEPRRDGKDKFIGRFGTAYGMQLIMNTLKVVGVDEWEQLKGKRVWALKADEWGLILGLAHELKPEANYFIFDNLKAEDV